jgi:hypothetical protein
MTTLATLAEHSSALIVTDDVPAELLLPSRFSNSSVQMAERSGTHRFAETTECAKPPID